MRKNIYVKRMQISTVVMSALLATTIGCGDDGGPVDATPGTDTGVPDAGNADASMPVGPSLLFGQVTAPNGAGIPFVVVNSLDGALTGETDDSGTFLFDDEALASYVDGDIINLKFRTEGYSDGFITVTVAKGIVMKADARLSPFDEVWAGVDPTVANNLANADIGLDIPANSLLDGAGNPVAEAVNVSVMAGDPTDEGESGLMPGNYWAEDGDGEFYLNSVAFANVEIATMNGTEITDIDDNAPVALKLRVPTALVDSGAVQLNDTIPWWTFDEVRGIWVQEGEATVYEDPLTLDLWTTSNISHLSWFNVDSPSRNSCFCGKVVDENSNPLSGQLVQAFGSNHNTSYSGAYTNAGGDACFTVMRSGYPNAADSWQSQAYVGSGDVASRRPFPGNPFAHPTTQTNCTKNAFPCSVDCLDIGMVTIRMNGSVSGTVTGPNNSPIANVRVVTSTGGTATTDAMGRYSIVVPMDTSFTVSISGGGVLSTTSGSLTANDAAPDVVQDFSTTVPRPPILRTITSDAQLGSKRSPIQCPTQPCGYTASINVSNPAAAHTVSIRLLDSDPDPLTVSPGPYRCIVTGGAAETDSCTAGPTSGPTLVPAGQPGAGRYESTFTFTCGSNLTIPNLDQCDIDFTVIDDANQDGVPEFQYDINTVVN